MWGRIVNGSWDGMISNLILGDADFVSTSLTMTPERYEVIDYLLPFGSETYAFFISRHESEGFSWKTYLNPLTGKVWLIIGASSLVYFILKKIIEIYENDEAKNIVGNVQPIHGNLGYLQNSLLKICDIAMQYWLILCSFLGYPHMIPLSKRGNVLRILIFFIAFTGNVVFISYRSSMTSELAVRPQKLPFNSLEGLIESDYE